MQFRSDINALRAIAVLLVIFYHAEMKYFSGGFIGVDVFFVISGFLITKSIIEQVKENKFSLIKFYEKRFKRILPALFILVTLIIPFAYFILLPKDLISFSKSIFSVIFFSSNIYFWKSIGYFEKSIELKPLFHTWSLSLEEQFYFFIPIFILLTYKLLKKYIYQFICFFTIISFLFCYKYLPTNPEATFYLLPTRAWELLLGALISSDKFKNSIILKYSQIISIIGLMLILFSSIYFSEKTPFPSIYTFLPTLGTALVIISKNEKNQLSTLLSNSVINKIGLISYSAYLYHQPIFAFFKYISLFDKFWFIKYFLILIILFISFISWKFIETPFRSSNISSRNVFFILISLMLFLFIFSFIPIYKNGFINNYDKEDQYIFNQEINGKNYVEYNFNKFKLKSFPNNNKLNVLIIGDSFAQDLVNAFFEVGILDNINISTHYISSRCGNLYLEEDFQKYIDGDKENWCNTFEGSGFYYKSSKLKSILNKSDVIILSSSWTFWQAKLLNKSIANLQKDFNKKIIVFGLKNFGEIDLRKVIFTKDFDRRLIINKVIPERVMTNRFMEDSVKQFINVQNMLCGNDSTCKIFTDTGKLITFDGGHLTKDGAILFGNEILKNSFISSILFSKK